jgi:elongation factor P
MVTSNQLTPGMVLSLDKQLYRVESSVKVTLAKGNPFIKTKLRSLQSGKVIEKNFQLTQELEDVELLKRQLEYLYLEGKNFLFLDIDNLEQVLVPADVIADQVHFLKEGVLIEALFYGDTVFSIELPQFLELMVAQAEPNLEEKQISNQTKKAILETGASITVPRFIEVGDVIKVDTRNSEYIQRV